MLCIFIPFPLEKKRKTRQKHCYAVMEEEKLFNGSFCVWMRNAIGFGDRDVACAKCPVLVAILVFSLCTVFIKMKIAILSWPFCLMLVE